MERVRRLSWAQRAELWRRWREGQSLSEIGRALERAPASVFSIIAAHGGVVPAPRRRSARVLRQEEREDISRGLASGESFRQMARRLGRAASTIGREVRRHGGRGRYRAGIADRRAWARSRRPKRCRLATHPKLRALVAGKLAGKWSPQQIAGWLRQTFPSDPTLHVSHETIYRTLFVQSRGVLKRELLAHLRRRKTFRRSKHATTAGQRRGQIIDAISIRERPPAVEDRAVPGHWEGDLLTGSRNSHIATLVERHSRYVILVRITSKDTHTVVRALTRRVRRLPQGLMASLTWDRGPELAAHRRFTVATNVQVYFCDPQSPWQRGSNENTTVCFGNTFPTARTCRRIVNRSSMPSPANSICALVSHWAFRHLQIN